jgi:hypothetical protein
VRPWRKKSGLSRSQHGVFGELVVTEKVADGHWFVGSEGTELPGQGAGTRYCSPRSAALRGSGPHMPGTHKQCPSGPLRAPPEHGGPPSKQLGDNPLSRTSGGPWPRRRSHRPDKRSSRHRRQRGSWPAACGGSRWPVVPAVRLVLERARPSPLGPVYDLRWQFSLPSYLVFIVVAVVAGTATGLYAGQG